MSSEDFLRDFFHCRPVKLRGEAKKDRRSELREHWIREHLPVMAMQLNISAKGEVSHDATALEALVIIDACLDAACGEEKK